jgi:hypothetical protein
MMNAASLLYEPLNEYKPLAPDIGIVDGPLKYFTTAGVRLPLAFSTRMTVVRLKNRNPLLLLFFSRVKEFHQLSPFGGRQAAVLLLDLRARASRPCATASTNCSKSSRTGFRPEPAR